MSALNQVTVPTFEGGDGTDAENFIASVRLKAYAEDKQHDEAWILDLVSASLRHDALRWHAGLDPSIQNDWRRLQKALLDQFCGTFQGIDGVECERFIHFIRKRIYAEGRAADNEWITTFVETNVVEDALRWHATLAPEVRKDWELLQKAMLDRYPPPEVRDRPIKGPTVPVPASAAPAPVTLKRGKIVYVTQANPSAKYYLSRTPHSGGYLVLSQRSSDALIVKDGSRKSPNTLTAKNIVGDFNFLGIVWCNPQPVDISAGSYHHARPVGVSEKPSAPATASYFPDEGTIFANVWVIAADGSVHMTWTNANDVKVPLLPITSPTMDIIVTGATSQFDSAGWQRGKFTFEPI